MKIARGSIVISILLYLAAASAAVRAEDHAEIGVVFRVNVTQLDSTIVGNAERLDSLNALLAGCRPGADARRRLVGAAIYGWASPEGGYANNLRLSRGRRDNLAAYLAFPDSLVTLLPASGVDWAGLEALVAADTAMAGREEVLRVLRTEPERTLDARGRVASTRQATLMAQRQGRTWAYMLANHFPRLRSAGVRLDFESLITPLPPVAPVTPCGPAVALATATPDGPAWPLPAPLPPRYWSLHTNALFDLAAIPNLGAELYLGHGFSLAGNWWYGWWKTDRRHRYWRTYGGELALRRYFGAAAADKPLTGHHLGIYGQVLTYDFELGGKGYMGGTPGHNIFNHPSLAAGLEYGYAMPITRRLNIDFSIGVGYLAGRYFEYRPVDTHYVWLATKQRHYFGPTKLAVSLVWLMGRGNVNKKGARL